MKCLLGTDEVSQNLDQNKPALESEPLWAEKFRLSAPGRLSDSDVILL